MSATFRRPETVQAATPSRPSKRSLNACPTSTPAPSVPASTDIAVCAAAGAASLDELVQKLSSPRTVWLMLPAGDVTEHTVAELGGKLAQGDALIDGGNSYFKDDVRRSRDLAQRDVRYLDVGTSGGIWGLE